MLVRRCWLLGVAALAVFAFAFCGSALGAKRSKVVRFKVLSGHIYQEDTWTSNSGTDNGCYKGSFADSGVTHVFMTAKKGAIVKATPSGIPMYGMVLKGLKFSGPVHQDGEFKDDWTPDFSPEPAWCGKATGPAYAPPSTADCGVRDVGPNQSGLEVTVPIGNSPDLPPSVIGTFYNHDPFGNCPSDDPIMATEPLFDRAKQPVSVFRHKTISLSGAKAKRSSGGIYYRGYQNQDGDSIVVMHWSLKLKRLK